MITIGVISDTHVPVSAPRIPARVFELFRGVDRILHAGDAVQMRVLEELEAVAPVAAVTGNMDEHRDQGLLPDKRVIVAEQCRIGLIHGWGSPRGLEDRALQAFEGQAVQAVVFGHSHEAMNQVRGGVLLFNPGTPCAARGGAPSSVGLLRIHGAHITGEIILL